MHKKTANNILAACILYIWRMSSFDSSNNLDVPHVFEKLTKPYPFTEDSFFETIRLVKKHMFVSKKRNKQNVIYPIERVPDK